MSIINTTITRVYTLTEGKEVLLLGLLILAIPAATSNFSLSTHVLIFGLFAMGYNLALGETGMLTFGHAAFFGLGAYGSGMFLAHIDWPAWLGFTSLLVGVGLATIGGLVIGFFSLRRRGTYLALITLAFAQMVYFIIFQWESLTGGDDGLFGVTTPELGIPGVFLITFTRDGLIPGQTMYFLFVFVVFMMSFIALRRIKRSNFGRALNAIRENENRARFLGYDVERYRLFAFTLSAAFSGLAGALYPPFLNYVGLSTLHWILSGEVNFFVLLGGMGSFAGAAVGTLIYFWLSDTISVITSHWQLPVGLILIGIVLFLPRGILGSVNDYFTTKVNADPEQSSGESGSDARRTSISSHSHEQEVD